MRKLRMLLATLAMVFLIAAPAHADGFNPAEDFNPLEDFDFNPVD